ncbi:MAG: class I adenylate-forming enzyme family protein [Phycisphaerales bacterium]
MKPLKLILSNLRRHPRRTFVVDDQREWSGLSLLAGSWYLAKAIQNSSSCEKVGIMLPTSGLFPLALIATWMLGRTAVPLNYLLKPDDLEYVIRDAELDLVITVSKMLEMFGEMPEGVKTLKLDEMSFKGIPPVRRAVKRPDDFLALLLYTSGTSGKPKGVMLTAGNLAANVEQCRDWVDFTSRDVMLGVLPQFHTFGLTALTLLPLCAAMKVVYTARFMPKRLLDLMMEHKPTVLIAIPSMYAALLGTKSATPEHFQSLRYAVSGGEPLPAAVFDGYRDRFNVTINEGYGLTETSPVTHWCRPQDHRLKSVGMPVPRLEQRIVDPNGKVLAANEEGEICLRGPNIMAGYHKLPEETAKVFDDEKFFRTGDMGRIDEDGYLYITGRIKEMLIIGGENVFPREIEEVLNRHESVAASAVIGMQDESRGEVALAFVELNEGAVFDEAALRAHCRASLPQFKVPREIRHLEQLPRNPTGKIMRRELKA